MIDAHCHLQFHGFEEDVEAVIQRASDAGVTKIINAGTQVSSSAAGVELAKKYDSLYAVIAVHPHHADKVEENWIEELENLGHDPKVVGIGECGLDYFSYKSNGIVDPTIQKEIFDAQIQLAHKLKLPLQIHNRLAGDDVISMLQERKHLLATVPGMFHCFAGSLEVLHSALDLGFFIGIDGNSMYEGLAPKETVALSDIIRETPVERLVIETDSPYLSPVPYRGKRNEPAYAIITARFVANLKGISFERLVEETDKNIYTIFGI
jgi:TatD DNase family protein